MAYGKISDKQREILEYIKKEILNKGYPPTVRDICEAVHLKSTSSVHSHLETLEKNGYIRRDPTKPRAIEIVDDNFNLTRREVVNVPMIGQVAAGQPMLAVENIDAYFPIPAEYMPNAESFMLKVKGESMINAGIFDGDNIIVERCSTAQNGEMVVALVDDSATVKTFYKEDGHIRLQPENDAYFPIPAEYMPNAESFMLKVKGESMINAGIFDGDNIIVERCSTAQNGEMVVALVDDSATVKTFYKEDGHIRLQPENDAMDPIIVPDCKILGKVFGVFRLFR